MSATVPAIAAPRVLVIDDDALQRKLTLDSLASRGYYVEAAASGPEGLAAARRSLPALILLDVVMPGLDGFEVCRTLRAEAAFQAVPILMLTSLDSREDRIRGLEAGADDFIAKPFLQPELFARVRSLLRVKSLYDEVTLQREKLAEWSVTLSQRVDEQVRELERLTRLRRFFSPQLAQTLLAEGGWAAMQSHRREVSVLFADLRGFTAFAESVDPQTLMAVLGEFHAVAGQAVDRHQGTLERFTGDGLMVFFNDPLPQPDHAERALALALEMQSVVARLQAQWRARGLQLGLGLGLSRGVATLGLIGFDARVDYAAIGSVTNRAARLCAEAEAGELLLCDAVWQQLPPAVRPAHARGPTPLLLRGFREPVPVYRIGAGLDAGRLTNAPAGV